MAFQRKKPAAIGVKAPFPGFIEPALASSIDKLSGGERWIHEIKFDGYRAQLHLRDAAVKVFSRRGNNWTKRFRKIDDDAWHVNAGSAIIDGEVVEPALTARPTFRFSRTNSKASPQGSCWSPSIHSISMAASFGNGRCMSARRS